MSVTVTPLKTTFDIRTYGAVGDGVHDDSDAFQNCINAAILARGKVVIPSPSNVWVITKPINIVSEQETIHIEAHGHWWSIKYSGPDYGSVFVVTGMKRCNFDGVCIYTYKKGVTFWDLIDTTEHISCSGHVWKNCHCTFQPGAETGTGWITRTFGGAADHSFLTWINCGVGSTDQNAGNIGWINANHNGLVYVWIDSGGSYLQHIFRGCPRGGLMTSAMTDIDTVITVDYPKMFPAGGGRVRIEAEEIDYTGVSGSNLTGCTRGVNGTSAVLHTARKIVTLSTNTGDTIAGPYGGGNNSMYFYGGGGSFNLCDFFVATGGPSINIYGGRYEVGERFFQSWWNSSATYLASFDGVNIASYDPVDKIIFALGTPTHLKITNSAIMGVDQTSAMVTATSFDSFGGGTNTWFGGSVTLDNVEVQGSGTQYWSLPAKWGLDIRNLAVVNSIAQATHNIVGIPPASKSADYTAALYDDVIVVDASGATRTITLPTAVGSPGKKFTIKRSSSGANNVVVDGAGTETIDGALTKTLASQWASITIESDNANWVIVHQMGTVT